MKAPSIGAPARFRQSWIGCPVPRRMTQPRWRRIIAAGNDEEDELPNTTSLGRTLSGGDDLYGNLVQ